MSEYDQIEQTKDFIQRQVNSTASIAIILGTGLQEEFEGLKVLHSIPFHDCPHFVSSTVDSHKGQLLFGEIEGKSVWVLAGRFHYYEGYSMKQVTYPIRVLKALGVTTIIMTNVAGGLQAHYEAGEILMVKDHINLLPEHPLRGANDNRLGLRFPDMKDTYDPQIRNFIKEIAIKNKIKLHEGVYVSLQGPSLETPAEYNFLHLIGADVVGMSTIPEVIVARHSGIKVCVLSLISNVCYPPENIQETTIESVIVVAQKSLPTLLKLISSLIKEL